MSEGFGEESWREEEEMAASGAEPEGAEVEDLDSSEPSEGGEGGEDESEW